MTAKLMSDSELILNFMTRAEIYTAIVGRLSAMEEAEVKHTDLWNRNVEFIGQETAWPRPAVFVEFGPIRWSAFKEGGSRTGEGTLKLHIVTDWNPAAPLEAFALTGKVRTALDGLCGGRFRRLTPAETHTNHDHEELVESIEVYSVRVTG